MNELVCIFEGCTKTVKSDVPFSPQATYTCAEHTEKAPDTPDRARFQHVQFDSEIPRRGKNHA